MRLEAALLSGLSLGQLCLASSGYEVLHHRRHADFHQQMRRDADAVVHQHQRRAEVFPGDAAGVWPTVVVPAGFTLAGGVQITPIPGATTTFSASPTPTPTSVLAQQSGLAVAAAAASVNTTSWSTEAETSCMNAVMALKGKASNPAGMAVCYNVPYLDQSKGVFEAELRMYNISTPTGDFVGVTPLQMMVRLEFAGATISQSGGQTPVKRDLLFARQLSAPTGVAMANGGAMPGGIMMPTEIAVRQYVGQINKNLLTTGMNLSTFQNILIPMIGIGALNPVTNKQVNTTLSSSEASFNAGVFSKSSTNVTDPKSLLGNPQAQIQAAAEGLPTPYDVPALSLGIFPVGLIVVSSWAFLFISVVGYGTFGRMQYRDQYRRAIKTQKEEQQRRI